MTTDKVIKSLKACIAKDRKCEECVCNNWLFDTCQTMLFRITINTLNSLEDKNKFLKEQVNESIKDLQDIIGG